ncbi:MAG TPA: TIM barrel protein [Gemmatimonadales bacterium]|nr:TIM barrel protein [Gemmatimonadales bacterium]
MTDLSRREMIALAAGAVAAASVPSGAEAMTRRAIRQSVCRWPYESIPLPDFARLCRRSGVGAIDLLHAEEWPVVRDAGLECSTGYPARRRDFLTRGFNDRANHALLLRELETTLPLARRAGVRNVIAMFGNRGERSEEEGIDACVEGLERIAPLAEETGITIVLEMLNSKVDHAGYDADSTRYGVAVVSRVSSPRVRLLYDIYHMQVMEGDVIRTIRANHEWFAHYHTAGNPGRNELDARQELQYPAIMRAIADTGFDGWVAHEFIPTRDPEAGLREAVRLCDV